MAQQAGPFKLTGSMGDFSFYVDKNGKQIVRQKGGPSKSKIKRSSSFGDFRNNSREFGGASKLGADIRAVLRTPSAYAREGSHVNRLTTLLRAIASTDKLQPHGARHAFNGEVVQLEGFQWNDKLALGSALAAMLTASIDPKKEKSALSIGSFTPATDLDRPKGASHYRLVASGVAFGQGSVSIHRGHNEWAGPILKIDRKRTEPIVLDLSPGTKGNEIFLVCAGVRFFQQIDGTIAPMDGGAFAILKAAKVKEPRQVWGINVKGTVSRRG